jgi:hypothetical protein
MLLLRHCYELGHNVYTLRFQTSTGESGRNDAGAASDVDDGITRMGRSKLAQFQQDPIRVVVRIAGSRLTTPS